MAKKPCKKEEANKVVIDKASYPSEDKNKLAKVMFGIYNGYSKGVSLYVSEIELKQNKAQLLSLN